MKKLYMKLLTKLGLWLLKGKTFEYLAKGSGSTPYFTVYIDGKPVVSKMKWKRISVVFGEDQ